MKKLNFKNKIMIWVLIINLIPLVFSYAIFFNEKIKNDENNITRNLLEAAKVVSTSNEIRKNLQLSYEGGEIEKKVDSLIKIFRDIDIIVVANIEGIKYSHLDKKQIGEKFVNPVQWNDIKKGEGYFSKMLGSMGITFRRFEPIYDVKSNEVIGFVMVGKYYTAISDMKKRTILMLSLLFIEAFGLAFILAIAFANDVNKHAREITGIDQLVDGMRANIHEFKNRLHVILGLINLEKIDMAKKNILEIQNLNEYDFKKFTNIKNSFLKAMLLGKDAICKERKIQFIMDSQSEVLTENKSPIIEDISTIIGNLVENSIDSFREYNITEKIIKIKVIETDKTIELEIWDNGEKIPQKYFSKIYERGFSTKGDLRGVGLNIIKSKVTLHNGTIEFEQNEQWKFFRIKVVK